MVDRNYVGPWSDKSAMQMRALAVAALTVCFAGCVNPAYHVGIMARTASAGDCTEALVRAHAVEEDMPGFPLEKQAHYCLYRGIAHACLGQNGLAWYWLARVEVMVRRFPMILTGSHFTNYQMAMSRLGNDPRIDRPLLLATAKRDMDRDAARYRRRQGQSAWYLGGLAQGR